MSQKDLVQALAELLAESGDRITRRWAKGAASALGDRWEGSWRDLADPLRPYVGELARLLRERSEDAPRLWGEIVRHHGGRRLAQRFAMSDLVRELYELLPAVITAWQRRYRQDPPLAAFAMLGQAIEEAVAAAGDDYVRQLRASRTHMREQAAIESILNHIDEGLMTVERDGTISLVTPRTAEILGVDIAELQGLSRTSGAELARRLHLRDDKTGRIMEPPFLQALRTEQAVRGRYMRLRRPSDGEERVVQTDAIPIRDDGELRGVVETWRDRTDEYRQREALASAYEELRRLHVQSLQRARTQALGSLLGGIAGSLNNAMNAIRLRTRLAGTGGAPKEHVAAIESAVDDVARTVAQLQELAAPRGAAEEGPTTTISLAATIAEALKLVRPDLVASAEGKELRVKLELDIDEDHVSARRIDLRELIIHLLLSAREAVHPGGSLHISSERIGDRVRLSVGPAPRSDEARETLSAVNELAAASGGTVRLEERGSGWAVRVELPRAATPAAQVAPTLHEPAAAPHEGIERVLIVDDDDDNRDVLAALLEAHGLETVSAPTAAEADELAAHQRFDAALVDLALPDRSGWDVIRTLRAHAPDLRIALVTGYEVDASERKATRVEAVFRKPVDISAVLAFLGRLPEERTVSP